MASKGVQPKDFKKKQHVFVQREGLWLEGVVEKVSTKTLFVLIEGDDEAHPWPGYWQACRHPTSEETKRLAHRKNVIKKFKPGDEIMALAPSGNWVACKLFLGLHVMFDLLDSFSYQPSSFPGHWLDVREKSQEDLNREQERGQRVTKAVKGTRLKVMDEGKWFFGVVTRNIGSQAFIQKDGDTESYPCPGDFQDIKFLTEEERRVYEAKRAAELREKSRQASQKNSGMDPQQLYRDRLEFAEKVHGKAHAQTYIAMWNLASFLFERNIKDGEALAIVESCYEVWSGNSKFSSPDKAKMSGKQLVRIWEAIEGEENFEKANQMREQMGMKQIIRKSDKAPEAAKGDLMGGLAAALANRAKIS